MNCTSFTLQPHVRVIKLLIHCAPQIFITVLYLTYMTVQDRPKRCLSYNRSIIDVEPLLPQLI